MKRFNVCFCLWLAACWLSACTSSSAAAGSSADTASGSGADVVDVASADVPGVDVASDTASPGADTAQADVAADVGTAPADVASVDVSSKDVAAPATNTWTFKNKTYSAPGITCAPGADTQIAIQTSAGNQVQLVVTLPKNPTAGPKTCKADKTSIGADEIVVELNGAPKMGAFWTCQGGTVDLSLNGGKVSTSWTDITMKALVSTETATFAGNLSCP